VVLCPACVFRGKLDSECNEHEREALAALLVEGETQAHVIAEESVLEVSVTGRSFSSTLAHGFENLENGLMVVALGLMLTLPLTESILRRFFGFGIIGSAIFVQHLVLYVGMLGSVIAARRGRLLSISLITNYLQGRWKTAAMVYANSFAVVISFYLAFAGTQFILAKTAVGDTLIQGVPLWPILLILPFGFALVAGRTFLQVSSSWITRGVAFLVITAMIIISIVVSPESLVLPAIAGLILASVLGAPIFTVLGGAAMILFWGNGQPIAMVPINHYRLTVDPTLPIIPLFTLVGYLLAESGAAKRLLVIFQTIFARMRGGAAIVTTVVCALFTAFTGASGVTILALGGLLMPILVSSGYSQRNALGLLTGAGSLGLLFPPSLPPILYAVVATTIGIEITMGGIFLAGLLPGALLLILTWWWGIRSDPSREHQKRLEGPTALKALFQAKWELILPVVALVALFSGIATPVEAAAFTGLYALIIEVCVYHDLKFFRDVPRVMVECGLLVGGVLLILGVAMGFTDFLFTASVPERLVQWAKGYIHSKWVFIIALNVFLLVVGCLMDIYSAIVVVAPLIIPLGIEFGIDPLHLAIIFLTNMELGFLTPPVGMNLFLSAYRFNTPMYEVIRSVLPILIVLMGGVLLISYVPFLTTALPHLFQAMGR
jgi:tripartite ATP-independent transporter DctM subunit